MTFEIYINGVKVKEYPYRLQAEHIFTCAGMFPTAGGSANSSTKTSKSK